MDQHSIRRFALQVIFLKNVDTNLSTDAAIKQVREVTDYDGELSDYLNFLVDGVFENKDSIMAEISEHLKKGWRIERINNINLSILQLAIFEIQNSKSIPSVAAVDEALNLASEFSDDVSKSFINGVLANFVSK